MGWKVETNENIFVGLEALGSDAEDILRRALYDGAKVVADKVAQGVDGLPVAADHYYPEGHQMKGVTATQKADLSASLGVAPHKQEGDGWNTVIGFHGYGSKPTKKYPNGLPNQLLARAVESGSSVRTKNPFIRKAVNASRSQAIEAMKTTFENEVAKKLKG